MPKRNKFLRWTEKSGFLPCASTTDGRLNYIPAWFLDYTEEAEDLVHLDFLLSEHGATCLETYGVGCSEQIDLWELPAEGKWVMRYWATDSSYIVNVVIESISDFMTFQSKWLSIMAQKLVQTDQYHWWQEMNKGFFAQQHECQEEENTRVPEGTLAN